MSNVQLLPRLSDVGVIRCMENLARRSDAELSLKNFSSRLIEYEPWISFAATGGARSERLAAQIGGELMKLAIQQGCPGPASDRQKHAFDVAAARWLALHEQAGSPELMRDDVWAFFSCVMLPEIVVWRYSRSQSARFAGGVRNTLQRLWMRGRTLDLREEAGEDRWRLLEGLSEDAMVQIFERASIAMNAPLARAIASGWLETADRIGRERMESVMRRATKLLRLRNQIIDLGFLNPAALAQEVAEAFAKASEGLPDQQDHWMGATERRAP